MRAQEDDVTGVLLNSGKSLKIMKNEVTEFTVDKYFGLWYNELCLLGIFKVKGKS